MTLPTPADPFRERRQRQEAIQALLTQLEQAIQPHDRAILEQALVDAAEEAIPKVLEGLKSPLPHVRATCAMVVIRLGALALPLFDLFRRNLSDAWLTDHPYVETAVSFVEAELHPFTLQSEYAGSL